MGEIVGAGLISHAPTIMLPKEVRYELNEGNQIRHVPGLLRLQDEVFSRLRPDPLVLVDPHRFTTVEHVLSAHEHRSGKMTSSELPRGMSGVPYDYDGDPELAHLAAQLGQELGHPTHASHDEYLPVYYATVNLLHYLHP